MYHQYIQLDERSSKHSCKVCQLERARGELDFASSCAYLGDRLCAEMSGKARPEKFVYFV